jgi:Spy/CpxP family protein refolding chaperone
MRKLSLALALLVAPALQAQGTAGPAAPPAVGRVGPTGPVGPGGDVASFLLSHTGELELSDQQVTRLAAIARRSADRRQAAMRTMDSAMTRGPQRRDTAGRGRFAPSPELRAAAQRLRDQRHSDLRDALGVLTPDQQATAWELSAMRGGAWMARGPMPGGFGRRGGPAGPGSRFRGGPPPRGDGRDGAREAPGIPGPGV